MVRDISPSSEDTDTPVTGEGGQYVTHMFLSRLIVSLALTS